MEKDLLRLVADGDFLLLKERLSRFNPFAVLKVKDFEIRHSNMIAWLLDPAESHGLGSAFFEQFVLALAGCANPDTEKGRLILQLSQKFLAAEECPSVSVEREAASTGKKLVDIQLCCKWASGDSFIMLIENKVYSRQGKNQLKEYLDYAEETAKKEAFASVVPVYLTLDEDDEPDDSRYCHLTYVHVAGIVRKLVHKENARGTASPACAFLESYLETLDELTDNDIANQELAKKIYSNNKTAVAYLKAHAKDDDFAAALCSKHGKTIDYIVSNVECDVALAGRKFILGHNAGKEAAKLFECKYNKRNFFFIDEEEQKTEGGIAGDWRGGHICGYFFYLKPNSENPDDLKGKLSLKVEVAPFAEAEKRQEFISLLRSKGFEAGNTETYTRLRYKGMPQKAVVIEDLSDEEKLCREMKKLFAGTKELRRVLHECLAEYK